MRELTKQEDADYFYTNESYESLVDSFEYKILYQDSVGDYQGDLYWVLQDGDRYSLLEVGYGSCSGCDSLEACCSFEEVVSLRDAIHEDIRWFDSLEDLKNSINEEKFCRHYWNDEGRARVYKEIMAL